MQIARFSANRIFQSPIKVIESSNLTTNKSNSLLDVTEDEFGEKN